MTKQAKPSKSGGGKLPIDKERKARPKPTASSTKRRASQALSAAKRLRTLGGLVELHSAVTMEVLRGDLSSNAANRINQLSRKHLREAKRQGRFPSEDELVELGAAVVALLTKLNERKAPPVSNLVIETDGAVVIDRGHRDPNYAQAKPRRVKREKRMGRE